MLDLVYATVIDNVDPDKAGRIKIKVPHLHAEVDDDLLPWAKPFDLSGNGSSLFGKSSIPEIDSIVWIDFHDKENFKKPFYIAGVNLNEMHPHTLFEDNVKSKLTGFASVYPNVKFEYLKGGVCFGATSGDSPEYFIVHPTGSIFYINKDGDITLKDKNANTIKTSVDGIDIKDKNTHEIRMDATGITLKPKSGTKIIADGNATPDGTGAFCGLKNCLFTGAPQTSSSIIGS